jgi:hypothetical protein
LAAKDSETIASSAFYRPPFVEYIPDRQKFTTEAQRVQRSVKRALRDLRVLLTVFSFGHSSLGALPESQKRFRTEAREDKEEVRREEFLKLLPQFLDGVEPCTYFSSQQSGYTFN